jgi:acetolactate synthase regulatory subunit
MSQEKKMSQHVTIHIHAHNEHSVLQRALLVFSRRRLRIAALQMFDLHPGRPAEIQVDVECDAATQRDLVAQLARIVEVVQVWSECAPPALEEATAPALQVA